MSGKRLTEQQALGLSDIAHGGDIGFINQRTWHSLRAKRLIFQREDGTWGLTDPGHDALTDAVRRWPVLLAPTPEPSEVAETTAGEREVDALVAVVRAYESQFDGGLEDTTEEGYARAVLASPWFAAHVSAAETKARADERERIAEAIEDLPTYYVQGWGGGWLHVVRTLDATSIARGDAR